jgi:hypothetical protein
MKICLMYVCSIGKNVKYLIDRDDEKYCFRLHNDRVYYVRCVNNLNL